MTIETAIKICTALVAAFAFFVAIWNVVTTRRHNRLSVRPFLSFHLVILPESPQLCISIKNKGLGTAIIKTISVYVDSVIQPLTEPVQWREIVEKLRIFDGDINGYAMQDKEILSPGEALLLLKIEDQQKKYNAEDIDAETRRLKIVVEFSSLYGEKFQEILGK